MLPIGTSTTAITNVKIAATHGVCRTGSSRTNTAGISLSRAMGNASRDDAITVIRTVFAVAKSAIALSMFSAPGHAFWIAAASGASLVASSAGEARVRTAKDTAI